MFRRFAREHQTFDVSTSHPKRHVRTCLSLSLKLCIPSSSRTLASFSLSLTSLMFLHTRDIYPSNAVRNERRNGLPSVSCPWFGLARLFSFSKFSRHACKGGKTSETSETTRDCHLRGHHHCLHRKTNRNHPRKPPETNWISSKDLPPFAKRTCRSFFVHSTRRNEGLLSFKVGSVHLFSCDRECIAALACEEKPGGSRRYIIVCS